MKYMIFLLLCLSQSVVASNAWEVVDSKSGASNCYLQTPYLKMFDGYQDTQVRLRLTDEQLQVSTRSNIDMGFDDVGLQVDGKVFIPAEQVVDHQNILFTSTIDKIVTQFKAGRSVVVKLRFWPSYPATRRFNKAFSLIGFSAAYNK